MKKSILLSTIALFSLSSIAMAASLESMSKTELTKMISGNTITTVPIITLNNELVNDNPVTIYFDKNGEIKGQFTNKPTNDPQNDEGKWTVKANGVLCATWDHWQNNKPICVHSYNLKNAMVFVNNSNNKFETMILKDEIKTGNKL